MRLVVIAVHLDLCISQNTSRSCSNLAGAVPILWRGTLRPRGEMAYLCSHSKLVTNLSLLSFLPTILPLAYEPKLHLTWGISHLIHVTVTPKLSFKEQ